MVKITVNTLFEMLRMYLSWNSINTI